MFFTDINGNHNLVTAVMNIFSSSGNLVSSSNGVKVVGITGAVVTDIEDLVVATVIPGLGKDMPTVEVKISTQGVENLLPTLSRWTPTVWTLREFTLERRDCSLGTSAANPDQDEIRLKIIRYSTITLALSLFSGSMA